MIRVIHVNMRSITEAINIYVDGRPSYGQFISDNRQAYWSTLRSSGELYTTVEGALNPRTSEELI